MCAISVDIRLTYMVAWLALASSALAQPLSGEGAASRPASAPASRAASAPAEPSLAQAGRLLWTGDYAGAQRMYEALLALETQRSPAAAGLGRALLAQGQYARALEVLGRAGPDTPELCLLRSEGLSQTGQYESALAQARRAADLHGPWAPAIFQVGQLLETLGRREEAVTVYASMDKVVAGEAWRTDAESLVALGNILDRYAILTGRRASEQAGNIFNNYYQEAYLRADKTYWPANVAAGRFALSKHRPDIAGQEFALAAKLNGRIAEVHVGLAAAHLEKWRFEPCLEEIAKALAINPHCTDALLVKALCLMQWRKIDQAKDVVDALLKVNPSHLEGLSLAAAICIRQGQDKQAQPFVDRVNKINARYAGLPMAIGEWLAASRQFESAERYYRQAIDLSADQAEGWTNLGLLYMQTGDEDKAREALERAHRIDDFRGDVVNYLNVLRALRRFEVKETEHFIVKVAPEDSVLLDQVAEYLEQMHKEVSADFAHVPAVKTIVEIFPNHAEFSVRITGKSWIGTVGASTGRVIVLVTPHRQRGAMGTFNWATVLRHEYAHTVTLSATRNRIPHWFTEACAVWQQPDRRNYDAVGQLVAATQRGRLFPVTQIDWGFIRPRQAGDRSLAYAQAEWMLEYVIATKGYPAVLDLLKAFDEGLRQSDAIRRVLGVSEKEFDAAFAAWAREQVKQWGFDPEPPPNPKLLAATAKLQPRNAAAQGAYARSLMLAGSIGEARAAAAAALKLDGDNVQALTVMAQILARDQKDEQAIALAQRLERLDPTSRIAPRVLAECYLRKRAYGPAIAALETCKQRSPLSPWSYGELASLYTQLGQPEKALPNLIELHRRTMSDTQYARQIAEIYRVAGNADGALDYYRQVVQINPYEATAYQAMAALHLRGRRYEQAAQEAQRAVKVQGNSPEAWLQLAVVQYRAGKAREDRAMLQEARRSAQKARDLDAGSDAGQMIEMIDALLAPSTQP